MHGFITLLDATLYDKIEYTKNNTQCVVSKQIKGQFHVDQSSIFCSHVLKCFLN